jgi:MinD-like ATPase involved in chromosome partitioning or flagellar assembly
VSVETDAGWSRAAGESTGRWRTILARASGRATVPGGPESDEAPEFPVQAPVASTYGTPAGYPTGGYPVQPIQPVYEAAPIPVPRPAMEWTPSQAPPASAPPPLPMANLNPIEQAVAILRRNIGVPRVIAFANPKGGVHKTTATVLSAATIGGVRRRGVVAWDDNELRGTLGLRAGSARHAKTIRHLVTELSEVELHTGPALNERLDDFLRHASDGSYDVLAGEEDPRFSWRLDPPTVRRVLDLLTRTHEIICVDTGNNVESGNWRTIMEAADQLVITSVPREDSAFSADWMMDVLTEAGREDLVANAVTLVSMTTPRPSPMQDDLVRHFRTRNRAVCVVPYDPSLEQGGWIDHTILQPATKEAWLQAAAVIVEPFGV